MWKVVVAVFATALGFASASTWAGTQTRAVPPQCTVKVTCPAEAPPPRAHVPPVPRPQTDLVCVKMCVDDVHWEKCKSRPRSWFANMKGHPRAEPLNNQATEFSTARFFTQCGTDCRPRGTMRFGHQSEYTRKWTVFRYGHRAD